MVIILAAAASVSILFTKKAADSVKINFVKTIKWEEPNLDYLFFPARLKNNIDFEDFGKRCFDSSTVIKTDSWKNTSPYNLTEGEDIQSSDEIMYYQF